MKVVQQTWLHRGMFLLAAYIVASYVLTVTMAIGDFHSQDFVRLIDMIEGEAHRPFVYRTLAPSLVQVLSNLTPESVREALSSLWESKGLSDIYPVAPAHATEGVWAVLVILGSLVGLAFAMRRLVAVFYGMSPLAADTTAIMFVLSLPLVHAHFIYDYPHLMLFTFCLGFMVERNWRWFYPLFALLCISKETAALIPMILLTHLGWAAIRRPGLFHMIAQGAMWLAASVVIRLVFAANPGGVTARNKLPRNIAVLTEPSTYLDVNKYLLLIDLNLLIIIPTVFLLLYGWRDKPRFLRRAMAVFLIPFALSFFIGCVEETRIFMEFTPIVFLLVLPAVFRLFERQLPQRQIIDEVSPETSPARTEAHRAN
jgi:hypothetical protein